MNRTDKMGDTPLMASARMTNVIHRSNLIPKDAKLLLSDPISGTMCMHLLLKAGAHMNKSSQNENKALRDIFLKHERMLFDVGKTINWRYK